MDTLGADTVTVMDEPRYGYGRGERPLWSRRDRDAEAIRRVLRRAGFRDFDERHLNGFAVEGASSSEDGMEPFAVAYCGDTDAPAVLTRYQRALERAGLTADPDPDRPEGGLLVPRRSVWHVKQVPRPARRMLTAAVVCAVLATVALIASWTAAGGVRFAGGIGSAVFGCTAVFLAGLWHQRRRGELEA